MDKRNNIEPYAAYNILLRPRLYDTTDLLLSMIPWDKLFKYKKKKEHAFLFMIFFSVSYFCHLFLFFVGKESIYRSFFFFKLVELWIPSPLNFY